MVFSEFKEEAGQAGSTSVSDEPLHLRYVVAPLRCNDILNAIANVATFF